MISPVSSKVSRIAATAIARARAGGSLRPSCAAVAGASGVAQRTLESRESIRPPGKTKRLGMKRWRA